MQGVIGDIANGILAVNPMILPLLVNGCFIGTASTPQTTRLIHTHHAHVAANSPSVRLIVCVCDGDDDDLVARASPCVICVIHPGVVYCHIRLRDHNKAIELKGKMKKSDD